MVDGFTPKELDPAWAHMRSAGLGTPRVQSPLDWKQWGDSGVASITFTVAGEVQDFKYTQLVQAKFHHPVAWLLAFHMSQGQPVLDTAVFAAQITYGLGRGNFTHDFLAGTLSPASPGPNVSTFGPVPAETIVIEAGGRAVAASAGTFPRTIFYRFGAFVAPQVWQ